MKKKAKKSEGSDTDKALAKAASVNLKTPKTEEPLTEKDEFKQAEENLFKRLSKK